eukprot:m51a1_g2219 hypothetical protein (148) ;mRNA; r:215709-217308
MCTCYPKMLVCAKEKNCPQDANIENCRKTYTSTLPCTIDQMFAAVARAGCGQSEMVSCTSKYSSCATDAGSDLAKVACNCYPSLLNCLADKGCDTASSINSCKAAFFAGNPYPCKAEDVCKQSDKDKGSACIAAPAVAALTAALGLF